MRRPGPRRPFYTEYAWAYDLLIDRPVRKECAAIVTRQSVFAAFRRALRPQGVLILDVREWEATAERKAREPVFRKRVATERGLLTFTSVTDLDAMNRRLIVVERHALDDEGRERSRDHLFVMQCWTREELHSALHRYGFGVAACFGAYDATVAAGSTDRLVVVAQLNEVPAAPQPS